MTPESLADSRHVIAHPIGVLVSLHVRQKSWIFKSMSCHQVGAVKYKLSHQIHGQQLDSGVWHLICCLSFIFNNSRYLDEFGMKLSQTIQQVVDYSRKKSKGQAMDKKHCRIQYIDCNGLFQKLRYNTSLELQYQETNKKSSIRNSMLGLGMKALKLHASLEFIFIRLNNIRDSSQI